MTAVRIDDPFPEPWDIASNCRLPGMGGAEETLKNTGSRCQTGGNSYCVGGGNGRVGR
jgi:hypothetical protein